MQRLLQLLRYDTLSHDYSLSLTSLPSLFSLYRKILFCRKPGWDQQPLPTIFVKTQGIGLAQDKVRQYADVCEFTFDGKHLPPTYLYVLAFRLHAMIFTHDGITFPLLGMIHLKNSISVYRSVTVDEVVSVQCELTSSQTTEVGLEFEINSKVFVADELVWESLSTYLYRIESAGRRARPPKASAMEWNDVQHWALPDSLGRQYAVASGDFNLIHLHPFFAKQFGFDRVLAHGMWSKARTVAQLMPSIEAKAFRLDVEFKLPVFMPCEVTFGVETTAEGKRFEMRDAKGRRPHLQGVLTYLD